MPGILTHYTFAKAFLPEEEKAFSNFVFSGTQGPDPFMAYGTNPLRKRKDKAEVNPWGEKMHHTPIEEVYAPMLSFCAKQSGREKEILFAYVDGLLMHYCLDRVVHPYVFARTGFDEEGRYAGIYVYYHGFFETLIDEAIAKKKGTFVCPDIAMPKLKEEDLHAISSLWSRFATVKLKEDGFAESYTEYRQVSRILWSKHGIKRALLKPLLGAKTKPYSLIYPPSMKPFESFDVLNEKASSWPDPVTGEESQKTMEELFSRASKEFEEAHKILLRAKEGEDVYAALQEFGRNTDHDGTPFGERKRYYLKDLLPLL